MTNEFDPDLRAQLHARRRERALETKIQQDKERLAAYMRRHGLRHITQDMRLKRIVRDK